MFYGELKKLLVMVFPAKKSWYQIIQDYVQDHVGKEFTDMKKKYGHYLMPYNQELYFYRKIFSQHYGYNNDTIIPYLAT